jgi:hypothetical protein
MPETPLDEEPRGNRWLPSVLLFVSMLVVLVMVAIPILRAVEVGRQTTPERSARDARTYVALQFATAVLERRAIGESRSWALPHVHDAVDALVRDLRGRDSADLEGAQASVTRVPCGVAQAPGEECFLASLARPGPILVTRMRFTVGIVDGRAIVVAIGATETI